MIATLSADKGVSFDFANNEKIKESGFAVDGTTVNGYVDENGNVTLNVNSAKALNAVVGHEITHILEGTELYDVLSKTIIEYANHKGDYASRVKLIKDLYKTEDVKKINSELVADLVGDYLFTDESFILSLSVKNHNLFQRIYDEIKYLCKIATAGSREAREFEKVKRAFEKAYRESGKANTESGVRYSLSQDGKQDSFDISVLDNYTERQYNNFGWVTVNNVLTPKEYMHFNQQLADLKHNKFQYRFNPLSKEYIIPVGDELTRFIYVKGSYQNPTITKVIKINIRNEEIANLVEDGLFDYGWQGITEQSLLVENYYGKGIFDVFQVGDYEDYRTIRDTRGKRESGSGFIGDSESIGDGTGSIGENQSSDEIAPIRKKGVTDTEVRYSLSDSEGRQLSQNQAEYFVDSKVRDENGNYKVYGKDIILTGDVVPFNPKQVKKTVKDIAPVSYECLQLLTETKYPFVVSTKGRLVAEPEYIELLSKCNCVVQISMV